MYFFLETRMQTVWQVSYFLSWKPNSEPSSYPNSSGQNLLPTKLLATPQTYSMYVAREDIFDFNFRISEATSTI